MSPITIFIFVIIPKLIFAGNILFFMPFIPKSGRITWMPIAEELAARNHNVLSLFAMSFYADISSN